MATHTRSADWKTAPTHRSSGSSSVKLWCPPRAYCEGPLCSRRKHLAGRRAAPVPKTQRDRYRGPASAHSIQPEAKSHLSRGGTGVFQYPLEPNHNHRHFLDYRPAKGWACLGDAMKSIQQVAENGIAWAAQHKVPGAWKLAKALERLTDRRLYYCESIAGTIRSSWFSWRSNSRERNTDAYERPASESGPLGR